MQTIKKMNKPKYVKTSAKEVKITPWTEVHIDLIVPYIVKTKKVDANGTPIELASVPLTFTKSVT